jgi:ketosteroid isomerase-like protein
MSQQDVDIVSRAFETLVRTGEPPLDRYDPDVVLDLSASTSPDHRGVYRGHTRVRRLMADYAEAWEDLAFEADRFIDAGDGRVIVALRARGKGRGSGAVVEAKAAYVVTLRNGKVVRLELFQALDEALEATGLT